MTLYDPYGHKIDKGTLRNEQSAPSLRSIRQVFSASPSKGLTPQKLASIFLQADTGNPHAQCELFEDMEEKDAHLASVIGTRKRAVTGLEINVEAPDGASRSETMAADLVRETIRNIVDMEEKLEDILDAIGKGYSVSEIIWGIHKQEAIVEDIRWREPKFFRFDQDSMSELRLLDLLHVDGSPLTPYKYIRHIHKSKSGIAVRGGLFRPCAWMYLFKNYTFKDWVTFAEIYAQPLRVGKYASSASEQEKDILLQAVANMGTDAAAIIPDSMLIEFVESGSKGASADVYERLCRFCDEQVSKVILGQTSSSDAMAGGLGSGQAVLHGDVRDDLLRSDVKKLAGTLNRDLVHPLVDLNLGPQTRYPKLRLVVKANEDKTALADHVGKLYTIGLPIAEDYLYGKFNIPKPKKGETIVGANLLSSSSPKASIGDPVTKTAANAQQTRDDIPAMMANRLSDDAEATNDVMIDQVKALLDDAETLEEFSERLPELLKDMDKDAITEIMAKAFAAADLNGQHTVKNGG